MFLIHTLFVFVVIYIFSALLAEIIFTSKIEQKLPTGVRVGLGYFLSLFYFVSVWLFLSIRQAWVFGLLLLGLYVYGKISKGLLSLKWYGFKELLRKHVRTLGVFLLSANLFFIPLYLGGHYGPFTEGGGDISVYSDAAKRLTDFNLNAVGLDETATLKKRLQRIKELINRDYSDWYRAQGSDFINPPIANYQINKIVFNLQRNPIQYTLCAQFAFLSGETNHTVFFALSAFLYSLILVSVWGFFRPYGRIPAIISVLIIGGSNGLVSAFYNMYLLQVLSMTFLALTLAVVPFVCLFSISGLRIYGFGGAFILMAYPHFLPIILPLLVIASINLFYKKSGEPKTLIPSNKNSLTQNFLHYSPLVIFFSFCLLEIYVGHTEAVFMIKGMFASVFSYTENPYAGKSLAGFSDQWLTFVFGLASQQHFLPLMTENKDLNFLFMVGTRLGLVLLATGFLLVIYSKFWPTASQQQSKGIWHLIGIYAALAVVICIYLLMSQTTLYTQAKGAQYLLICLYFVMLLPLAIIYKSFGPIKLRNPFSKHEIIKKVSMGSTVFVILLFVFCAFLWIPRMIYAYRIGHHFDRSTVMEPSFFSEAKKIKTEDRNAFVIFEPRTSSDVYFPYQTFAGYRLIPTQHLILSQLILGASGGTGQTIYKIPSDFVRSTDIPHLWSLTAVKEKNNQYEWKAKRVFRNKSPYIYFTAHSYERNFVSRPRFNMAVLQSNNKDWGKFTYIRNGSAIIYLPPGGPYSVQIKLIPRHDDSFEEIEVMSKGITKRAKAGEFPAIKNMSTHGYIITLNFNFEASPSPRVSLVSKYDKEYFFNARLNGKEMADFKQ